MANNVVMEGQEQLGQPVARVRDRTRRGRPSLPSALPRRVREPGRPRDVVTWRFRRCADGSHRLVGAVIDLGAPDKRTTDEDEAAADEGTCTHRRDGQQRGDHGGPRTGPPKVPTRVSRPRSHVRSEGFATLSGGKKKKPVKTVRLDTDADPIAKKRADWRLCRQYKGLFVRVGGEFDDEE